ncbi:MAG: CerR family C-terminal domain-containing protein, partial [Burkholderiales bacterium]|nr:CerR family C-terminal domain-containing protein [Burkholderiales bacterium]
MLTQEKLQDDTRHRLIMAGLIVFGQQGFEGASTREIAAQAQTNIASIAYHFGSKEKLYIAVADYIAGEMSAQIDRFELFLGDSLPLIQSGELPSAQAIVLLKKICRQWIDELFSKRKHHLGWMSFIVREEANATEAFNILYSRGMGRFLSVMANLIGCIKRLPPTDFCVRFEAFALIGLMLSFEHKR